MPTYTGSLSVRSQTGAGASWTPGPPSTILWAVDGASRNLRLKLAADLSIPPDETIQGVEVTLDRVCTPFGPGAEISDVDAYLFDGASTIGTPESSGQWASGASSVVYGSSSTLWGASLLPANFGIGFGLDLQLTSKTGSSAEIDTATIVVSTTKALALSDTLRRIPKGVRDI